jgi:Kdo2-lipid IVA lauroyltransferase/acyltransferase
MKIKNLFTHYGEKARTVLEYAAVCVLMSLLRVLPRALASNVALAVGWIAYCANGKLRQTGERNLQLAFSDMSRRERRRILLGCFMSAGRMAVEFSRFATITPETLRQTVDIEGLENLDAARAGKHGVILVTAHLGAWELAAFALSAFGYPFSFLVRRIENPKVERLVEKMRTRFGNHTIDKTSAAQRMLKILRANDTLGLLVDINVPRSSGIFVNFFDRPASTTFIAAKLALRTGAAVLPALMPWEPRRGRFVLYLGTPLNIEHTGNEKEDVRRLTALYTQTIESYVRRYPDQWLWIHKRWRTQPMGESNLYKM